jgi:hypothetical protein
MLLVTAMPSAYTQEQSGPVYFHNIPHNLLLIRLVRKRKKKRKIGIK